MGFFSAIGNAISKPVRGFGRILRGNFKQGFGDIGSGLKSAAPILAATTGIGTPALLAMGAGGGMLENAAGGKSFGDVLKGGASGAAGVGLGKLASGVLPGGGAAGEAAGGAGGAASFGSRIADAGRGVVDWAKENPELALQGAGIASDVYGQSQIGKQLDREWDLQESEVMRNRKRHDNASPIIEQLLRELMTYSAAPAG